ncbi:MAG: ComF family protein [Saprospiraceae bacterium]
MKILNIYSDIIYTFFPNLCLACDKKVKSKSSYFCISCSVELPYSDHFEIKDHFLTRHFYGRIPFSFVGSLFIFREGSAIQSMLHRLKYKKKSEVGTIMGELLAQRANDCSFFPKPDIIIPVPIHFSKMFHRGYNQSTLIAAPLAYKFGIPLHTDLLLKQKITASQTRKSRSERIDNVAENFIIHDPNQLLKGKHILLVDDVITTGATIESCAQVLLASGIQSLSILSAAAAE